MLTTNHVTSLFDMNGRIALVTGGVQGLGWQAGEALSEAGATVILTSRNERKAQAAADKLQAQTGNPCRGLSLEVSDENSWKSAMNTIQIKYQKLDVLVNNAGGRKVTVSPSSSFCDPAMDFLDERPLEEWQYSLDVMLTGVFLGCRAASPIMKKQGYGKIVNIASIDGIRGRDLRLYQNTGLSPTVPDYMACKGAVINFTRGIAVVLAPYGIRVNCLSPGGFKRSQPQAFIDSYSYETPLGCMGDDAKDLKGAVLFACAPASDYMVGHNLVIDGGFTAW
ncbi:SDR family oxidoreductase [Diplocloster modestus]|uniref:SDR family oxidoreductase n=1 Tax=Diplocloster modestus TaxID=2850322 RepID=A0ABS6KAW6_9FIRM|nr:SDR family oxidoreductase [Diplocloster modestus]MBU9727664.1 SDR family oxidoreductase [Diplocloster modestus]